MAHSKLMVIARPLAVAATLAMLPGCGDGGGSVQSGPYVALGEVIAKATSDLFGGHGRIAVIVSEADKNSDTAAGLAHQAFKAALQKQAGIQISATETAPMPGVLIPGVEPLPVARFVELVQKHAGDDAIVSFMGVPHLASEQIAQLPNPRPKIIIAMTYNPPAKALFQQGIVHLAAIPRAEPPAAGVKPKTISEWFDASFVLVTRENAGLLPY